jgi:hypothetical protein
MNHVMLEELLALLSVVPKGTIFQLGAPPIGAERTLSIQVYCQVSKEDAERIQEKARTIACCQAPGAIGPRAQETPDCANCDLDCTQCAKSTSENVLEESPKQS